MNIIDPHIHIYPPERQYKLLRWIKRSFPEHPVDNKATAEDILNELTASGIDTFINLVYPLSPDETESLNQFNAGLCRSYKNMYGFGSITPQNENKELIIKKIFFDMGLMGLKFHPFIQRIDLRDPAMEEAWSICERFGRPVYLHTGYESFYNGILKPQCVRSILDRHPDLNLIISHACFPDLAAAFDMARDFAGVYIDLTNVPGSLLYFQSEYRDSDITAILMEGIKKFRGRIFFGTDHPVGMGSVKEIYLQLKGLNLDDDTLKDITYNSSRAFIEKFSL